MGSKEYGCTEECASIVGFLEDRLRKAWAEVESLTEQLQEVRSVNRTVPRLEEENAELKAHLAGARIQLDAMHRLVAAAREKAPEGAQPEIPL